jgi:hypothetical protein
MQHIGINFRLGPFSLDTVVDRTLLGVDSTRSSRLCSGAQTVPMKSNIQEVEN